jgi:uncharacterized protein
MWWKQSDRPGKERNAIMAKPSYPDYSTASSSVANIVRYYLLVFGIAWLVWIPLALCSWNLLPIQSPGMVAWLAASAPIFAGTYMLIREYGKAGIQQLLIRCGMWKFHPVWYAVAFGLPVGMILLDLAVYRLVGGQIYSLPLSNSLTGYLSSVLLLIPLAIFEEAGWRGYASPRLQARLGRWGGSLVLGGLWGLWHIPYYLIRGASFFPAFDLPYLVLSLLAFVVGTAGFETLMTWLFRHTRGSLLFACIFHASNNAFAQLAFLPTAAAGQGLIFVWSAIVGWAAVIVLFGLEKWILTPKISKITSEGFE